MESVIRVLVTVDYSGFSADGSSVQAAASALNYAAMPVENVKLSANYVQVNARLLRVKEAAAACGYTDAKHFARRFRLAHDVSPSAVGQALAPDRSG